MRVVIWAPLSDIITFQAVNIWGKFFSAEGFLYWISPWLKSFESPNKNYGHYLFPAETDPHRYNQWFLSLVLIVSSNKKTTQISFCIPRIFLCIQVFRISMSWNIYFPMQNSYFPTGLVGYQ